MMSGIAGIGAVVFGIFWTIMAVQMGAPIFFCRVWHYFHCDGDCRCDLQYA